MNFLQEQNDQITYALSKSTTTTTSLIKNQSFEYIGNTALSIKGYTTVIHYRFPFTGDKQIIDDRDAAAMLLVPVLRKVKT